MNMIHTLHTFDTEFSAHSIEWCPTEPFRDILVCGTYQLSQDEEFDSTGTAGMSKRLGRIYLIKVAQSGHLNILQQIDTSAVLDMKWAHRAQNDKVLLGIVNSLAYLQLYELIKTDKESLNLLDEIAVNDMEGEVLALSLDWSSGKMSSNTESHLRIIVSDSQGFETLVQVENTKLTKVLWWYAHQFEGWIAAFDYWDTNILYTGGDDSKFRRFDTRVGRITATNKCHRSGVTSIHSNASKEYCLASGSYDEHLRIWDTRSFNHPISETNLGGGIWRLKWDPFDHRYLFAACMYGGFRIIDCVNESAPSVVAEYNEHKSISYGCDWCFLSSEDIVERKMLDTKNTRLLGTCSFYDHALKISAFYQTDH